MMSNFAGRISICHTCQKRQQTCSGACSCTIDGRDITEHAEGDKCPENRFVNAADILPGASPPRPAIPLAGDIVEALAKQFGADRVAKRIARMFGKADCGCAKRRERLNALDRRLRKMLGLQPQ